MKRSIHRILSSVYEREDRKFLASLRQPGKAQDIALGDSLRALEKNIFWNLDPGQILTYAEFKKKIPLTDYGFYQEKINDESVRQNSRMCRWEPTSGSTQARKWIPYNKAFLDQLHRASSPWLRDIYRRFPGTATGTHYWSLSWLPEDLRALTGTDDSELFPFWQRILLKKVFPVPGSLARMARQEAFWFATLVYLAAEKNLTLISVWSPTFLLQIIEDIRAQWTRVNEALTGGAWPSEFFELKEIKVPRRVKPPSPKDTDFLKKLWPKLNLISAWDSSTSEVFAAKLAKQLPYVEVQGKGLWATEGVVTIPYGGTHPVAVNSHFYEFKNLESDQVLTTDQLSAGMFVSPIITAANGFWRYKLDDRLEVTGKFLNTPTLKFLGRDRSVDMVGEKIDEVLAQNILYKIGQAFRGHFYSVRANLHPKPHYELLCCAPATETVKLTEIFERNLLEIHHYQVARDLGQLGPAVALNFSSEELALTEIFKSSVKGQNKIEALIFQK